MVWMSAISLIIFLGLCLRFFVKNSDNHLAQFALGLKIIAGLCLGLLYKFHLGGGDTFQYFMEGKTLSTFLIDHPADWFSIYFNTIHVPELVDLIIYYDQPRALFFAKIISIFYIFSGGNYWIISAFLSLINFTCIHILVQELDKSFPRHEKAFSISFYFLPTFVFWTSGLLKESLAIGALALLVSVFLHVNRTKNYTSIFIWLLALGAALLLWELKYYYAAIAVPLLLALSVFSFIRVKRSVHPAIIILFCFLGVLVASVLHYNLSLSRVMEVVYENYQKNNAGVNSIQYYHFDGNWYGFLINIPLALFSGLFRPIFFDASNFLGALVSTENLTVLIILMVGLWKSKFQVSVKNPYILTTLLYVFSLAVLMAFSSPNLGSLSRYKVAYWPFFVTLVLSLFFEGNKKGQNLQDPDLKNHH